MNQFQSKINAAVAAALFGLGFSQPGLTTELDYRLRVIYHPPRLSIEAQGVSLPKLLQAIGEEVGFRVVAAGGVHPGLTFAINEAPLADVLGWLLRTENHAIVYQEQGGGKVGTDRVINEILLLGPSTYAEAALESDDQGQGGKRSADFQRSSRKVVSLESPWVDKWKTSLFERGRTRGGIMNRADPEVNVGEILRLHTVPGHQELTGNFSTVPLAGHVNQPLQGMSTPPSPLGVNSMDLDETLAITARLAQQNLQALMEGLATATSSLLGSRDAMRR